jgi:hypothetical protein
MTQHTISAVGRDFGDVATATGIDAGTEDPIGGAGTWAPSRPAWPPFAI